MGQRIHRNGGLHLAPPLAAKLAVSVASGALLYGYLLMADFADYCATQARVDELFRDQAAWAQRAIKNVAGMGWFSSDRTIAEYVERVWSVQSLG